MIVKTQLWPHQQTALDFALNGTPAAGCAGLWLDMRTGKTLTSLAIAAEVGAERILIIAPRVPAKNWAAQIEEHTDGFPAPILLSGGDGKRRVAALRDHWAEHKGRVAVVVNYEACITEAFRDVMTNAKWDLVIADEAHRLKGGTSKIGKLFRGTIRKNTPRMLALSGTPTPQGYIDYYGVYGAIHKQTFGVDYWTHFKRRFVVCGNPKVPQMVTGFRDTDLLDEVARQWAVSVREEDCWDVETPDEQWLWVDLCAKTRAAYDQLEALMIAEVEGGDVIASNALVKALRLQQLAGGVAVVGEGDDAKQARMSSEKAEELAGFLEDRFEPVVIFAQFLGDLDLAREAARKLKRPYSQISGGMDGEAAFHEAAARGENPIIGCQIQAGSEGIELSESRLAVYLSTGYASARYAQSRARIRGHKQTRRCHYVHIGARGTIDEAVAKALKDKRAFEAAALERLNYRRHAHV